jgi:retron-type reverse transcriptase
MKMLEHDIADRRFLEIIQRFLKAGVMENGKYLDSESGSPQGGLCGYRHKFPYAELYVMPS